MEKKNTIIKDALILLCITIISGVLLGLVYEITKTPIADANEKAKQEAYLAVFPDAASFETDDALSKAVADSEKMLADAGVTGGTVDEALIAQDSSGSPIGYVMSLTATAGYGGDIKLSIGITSDKVITGLEVLSASETAGLGAKCTEPEFKDQFKDLNGSDKVAYSKTGKSADNEIDAISGATITSSAVTEGVNCGLYFINNYSE